MREPAIKKTVPKKKLALAIGSGGEIETTMQRDIIMPKNANKRETFRLLKVIRNCSIAAFGILYMV